MVTLDLSKVTQRDADEVDESRFYFLIGNMWAEDRGRKTKNFPISRFPNAQCLSRMPSGRIGLHLTHLDRIETIEFEVERW